MEPEGSLPRSQEPSTRPYPEPDWSNSYHPILFNAMLTIKKFKTLHLMAVMSLAPQTYGHYIGITDLA
jgi:hypothetical protein